MLRELTEPLAGYEKNGKKEQKGKRERKHPNSD